MVGLEEHPLFETQLEAAIDCLDRQLDRARSHPQYTLEQFPGFAHQFGRRNYPVHEPDPLCLSRIQVPAGQDEFQGATLPHQPGEPLRAAVAGSDSKLDLGLAEHGVLTRNPDVARHCQLTATPQGVTVHGGDDRFSRRLELAEYPLAPQRPFLSIKRTLLPQFRDVGPGGERFLAGTGQDGTADIVAFPDFISRAVEFTNDLVIEGIQFLGTVQCHGRDSILHVEEDMCITHGLFRFICESCIMVCQQLQAGEHGCTLGPSSITLITAQRTVIPSRKDKFEEVQSGRDMASTTQRLKVIGWTDDGAVTLLDQTQLPAEEVYLSLRTVDEMVEAIQALRVRGAPLIGIAAAMGLAAAARAAEEEGVDPAGEWLADAVQRLGSARPTAVNLRWALERVVQNVERKRAAENGTPDRVPMSDLLRAEAELLWREDEEMCAAIGRAGARLVPERARVMTHCNAGMLATGGIGTALGVIYTAREEGKEVEVVSCEARPLRQGGRLTAWELSRNGVPVTVIVDSAAGMVMRSGVDLVVTGADRIASNGDTANKIGTYNLAVLAQAHGIPFYIAAPSSTFDLSLPAGERIPIEVRSESEVPTAPGATVYNPAFDVTPQNLIAGIITERGLITPPFEENIQALLGGK